jgi:uncharacterized UPF0146 family protein
MTVVATPRIRYARTTPDWHGDFVARVRDVIAASGARRICEIGAGANPALSPEFVAERGLSYLATDVSEAELRKAPSSYEKMRLDICAPNFEAPGAFDLAFSASVAEHISDPALFHRNVRALLAVDGRAMHVFSTLYAPLFVANRLLPGAVSTPLVERFFPARAKHGSHGKFPALYRWCRGPTRSQLDRLEACGFVIEEYVGFFGHFYYHSLPALQRAANRFADWLVAHPTPWLTSYAYVVLRPRAASFA